MPHGHRRLTRRDGRGALTRRQIKLALHDVIERYMESRRERFPAVKLGPKAPLFVDRRGDRLKRGGAHYLVERSYRAASLASGVPAGAMVPALRHMFATGLAEGRRQRHRDPGIVGGHESLNTAQGYIDATANATRQAARANRTYRALQPLARGVASDSAECSSDEAFQRLIH